MFQAGDVVLFSDEGSHVSAVVGSAIEGNKVWIYWKDPDGSEHRRHVNTKALRLDPEIMRLDPRLDSRWSGPK